ADRLHQGALPAAAALFHRLSGGDEARRRLAHRLEVLSLRYAGLISSPSPASSCERGEGGSSRAQASDETGGGVSTSALIDPTMTLHSRGAIPRPSSAN